MTKSGLQFVNIHYFIKVEFRNMLDGNGLEIDRFSLDELEQLG